MGVKIRHDAQSSDTFLPEKHTTMNVTVAANIAVKHINPSIFETSDSVCQMTIPLFATLLRIR